MSQARTYTKIETADAAAAAAMHGVRVIMHPTSEIEFSPNGFAFKKQEEDTPEAELQRWVNAREARRRA
ncbi:hypothetical protein ABID21_001350 [Pseudorhizobium tarimense]|uniref:Uncharacterized protein n=1 Tax=Pseudorhizobium tarimense TaxID=1079109 RepID=A0ABV2H3Y1_9HYPH|nr:hypothetical protein [Pseudorhizobium tarimense]MCJ8518339.1 hypothetical protein [Pseudorhizobium tarimense]